MSGKNKKFMFDLNDTKSVEAEAFRTLRTNIQFTDIDKKMKSIVVTSSLMSEGKSTIVVNLAATFAKANKKVLIIDADLRRPTVKKYFEIENNTGLTNLLVNDEDINNAIFSIDHIENLYVIPSGPIPPSPSELLSSQKMKNLMEQLKSQFDIIIVDSPPVGIVSDASLISAYTEAVILVAYRGKTPLELLKKSKDNLDKAKANIIGVVMVGKQKGVKTYGYY